MGHRVTNILIVVNLFLMCESVVYAKNINNKHVRSKRTAEGLENSCENVRPFFQMKNVTVQTGSSKGGLCGGDCCDDNAEAQLRNQGQKDFASLLRHNSISIQGLLSSTSSTLQSHMLQLVNQSENKTLLLFGQVYLRMSVYSKGPIETFYSDIRKYVLVNITDGEITPPTIDVKTSTSQFFTDLFPLVFLHGLANNAELYKDFSVEYKSCLKRSTLDVLPFGEIPKQISYSLSKSLEAMRLLFQAFSVGLEVLNATDAALVNENAKTNAECHDALVKLNYCPKCMGLVKHTRPCTGYCLNVLRGCLTKYVAELDSPWNSYVEGIEKLVNAMKQHNNEAGVNADDVIRELDNKVSEAIMYAMTKGTEIDYKVKKMCGMPKFSEKEDPLIIESSTAPPNGAIGIKSRFAPTRMPAYAPPPETQLLQFLTSISKTKGFYGNLADTLCQDENFAEPNDRRCWNGERIAEYTKTVVDSSLDMQKYNPEVKPTTNLQNGDRRIADLADKLRQVHHLVMTSLGSTYSNELNDMQRDSSDGSGSGNGPDFEEDGEDYTRGSGSGDGAGKHHPVDGVPKSMGNPDLYPTFEAFPTSKPSSPDGSGAGVARISLLLVLCFLINIFRLVSDP